jgi:hypothetical protein
VPTTISDWASRYPGANWGIVTGEDLDVYDFDATPEGDGWHTLSRTEAELGLDLRPRAIIVQTGGGVQLWFSHDPAGRAKTTAGVRPGVDVRAGHMGKGHGYVMAPGSVHPTGRIYRVVSMGTGRLELAPEALIVSLFPPDREVSGGCDNSYSQYRGKGEEETQESEAAGKGGENTDVGRVRRPGRGGASGHTQPADGHPSPVGLSEGRRSAHSGARRRSSYQPTADRRYCQIPVTAADGEQRTITFHIDKDASLTAYEEEDIRRLRRRHLKFDATWRMERGPRSWPFRCGRNSPSEYEASLAFFLRGEGWQVQPIMNAIAVWNRLHGNGMPEYASRYGPTLAKAFRLAKRRSAAPPKGRWKWHLTKVLLLGSLLEDGPQTPKELSTRAGRKRENVRVTLGRMAMATPALVTRVAGLYAITPAGVNYFRAHLQVGGRQDLGTDLEFGGAAEGEGEQPILVSAPRSCLRLLARALTPSSSLIPSAVVHNPVRAYIQGLVLIFRTAISPVMGIRTCAEFCALRGSPLTGRAPPSASATRAAIAHRRPDDVPGRPQRRLPRTLSTRRVVCPEVWRTELFGRETRTARPAAKINLPL